MQVYRATDGKPVELAKQWGPQERALLIFTRSLGCPFCQELAVQLRRDVMPQLATLRVNVLMVSIGELSLVVRTVRILLYTRTGTVQYCMYCMVVPYFPIKYR